jgi:hypothetical protein
VLSQIALSVCRLELEQFRDPERVDLAIIGLVAGVFQTEFGEGDLAQRNASARDKAGAIVRHRTERAGAGFDGEICISDAAEQVTDKRDQQPANGEFAFDTEQCTGPEACAAKDRTQDRAKADILAIEVCRADGRSGAGTDLR